jgi:anti-sigma B factor antagonist
MLNVQHTNIGAVSLLNLEGQVVVGKTEVLRDVVQTLPLATCLRVDLSHVSQMDAHGLGLMLQLREQAQARGMRFELMNVCERLRQLLQITRLDTVFQIKSGVEFSPLLVPRQRTPVAA